MPGGSQQAQSRGQVDAPQGNRLSYWQQHAGAMAGLPPSDPPGDADVVVIGGGLAGLATAIAILQRQPGIRVVVLEAQFVGFGASGRNGGLLSPLPAPVWLLTTKTNADHAWATHALNAKVHALGAWLDKTLPDSEVRTCKLQLQAMGRLTTSGVAKVAEALAHAGIGYGLGPDPQRGGKPTLELPTFTVHPYRLVRALAAHAMTLGARICEHTAVAAVEGVPGGALVRLAGGRQVRAGKLVICTNAYTGSIAVLSPPRAKVVRNYMIATEPLDAETVQRLGGGGTFMVELNKSYVFYRLHQGRLVYGGIETFFRTPESDFEVPASIHKALERHLAKSIPWRANLPIAVEWGGAFHSTATDLPIIQRAADAGSIVFNIGYGGTGVALTNIFAAHAAAMALDLPLPDEDARLGEIVRGTGVPIKGLLRLGAGVAWDVAKGLVRGRA